MMPASWYLRTRDDAGGSDDADDTSYGSEHDARAAATAYATEADEADGQDAESYLEAQLRERAGKPDPTGQWCLYWDTVSEEGGHVEDRYPSQDAAAAAAQIANASLRTKHGDRLLCGYDVRHLDGGQWVPVDDEAQS